jgi:hypothetical protein
LLVAVSTRSQNMKNSCTRKELSLSLHLVPAFVAYPILSFFLSFFLTLKKHSCQNSTVQNHNISLNFFFY